MKYPELWRILKTTQKFSHKQLEEEKAPVLRLEISKPIQVAYILEAFYTKYHDANLLDIDQSPIQWNNWFSVLYKDFKGYTAEPVASLEFRHAEPDHPLTLRYLKALQYFLKDVVKRKKLNISIELIEPTPYSINE